MQKHLKRGGSVTLRLTAEQRERWGRRAAGDGRDLSGWIRRVCDLASQCEQELPGTRLPTTVEDVERQMVGAKRAAESFSEMLVRDERDSEAGGARDAVKAARAFTRTSAPVVREGDLEREEIRDRAGQTKVRGKKECVEPVGPGIYCPSCGEKH